MVADGRSMGMCQERTRVHEERADVGYHSSNEADTRPMYRDRPTKVQRAGGNVIENERKTKLTWVPALQTPKRARSQKGTNERMGACCKQENYNEGGKNATPSRSQPSPPERRPQAASKHSFRIPSRSRICPTPTYSASIRRRRPGPFERAILE